MDSVLKVYPGKFIHSQEVYIKIHYGKSTDSR